MFDTYVEIWDVDHYLLVVHARDLSRWTSKGYTLADRSQVFLNIDRALRRADQRQLCTLWTALFGPVLPRHYTRFDLEHELREAALRRFAHLTLLIREFKRGWVGEPMKWIKREGIPRLDTEHYIVIQALDKEEQPVAGVQLELVIAGGEIKGAATGQDGFARVERIHAGSVLIRVLNLDGSMWKALDGAASQPSSNDERVRWHIVSSKRESLGDVAKQYGIKDWQTVWEHPKNQALRRKRKRPAALRRGDQVALPALNISEIVRSTDATHRIQVERHASMLRLTWSV